MSQNQELQDSIRQIYIVEFDEQVEALESGLIKLEKNPSDESVIGEIFRYSHNIKGSSAAVGYLEVANLAHVAETLMSSVKNHFVKLNDEILTVLFRFIDSLKDASGKIKQNSKDYSLVLKETEFIKSFTQNLLQGGGTPAASPAPPVVAPALIELNPEPPKQAEASVEPLLPLPPPVIHEAELSPSQAAPVKASGKETPSDEFIKISARKVDRLIELFGEQVILQSTVDHAFENIESDGERAKRSLTELRKITRSLQLGVVTLRMISVSPLVKRLERSIRDAAKMTGKDIRLHVIGENIEVDKTILDVIANPLTHLVRNAVDHGIESGSDRELKGKPAHGTLTLAFKRSGGAIDIIVEDDGGGLNRERILQKAIKMGLAKADRNYTDAEVNRFIFKNGFSTNETANELSGRGVGMDVVLSTLEELKGAMFIDSVPGLGTKFTCRLPLSLDMFNGTIVKVEGERYVFSNSEYKETVNVDLDRLEKVGQEDTFIRLGDRVIKLIDLRKVLIPPPSGRSTREASVKAPVTGQQRKRVPALVLEFRGVEFGFLVEELLAQEQIVLKRISDKMGRVSGAIGCTILGDGKVALILSLSKILETRLGMAA